MAIAMYGYSWLKPAGCPKTMLGRREEEVEREEVERQLREVELQERMQQEAEEQERLAQQAETGEPEGGRDLDEDIPDADGAEEDDLDEDDEEEEGFDGDDGMGGDLDDEIPDADDQDDDEVMSPAGDDTGTNWVYDTRREPDSDEEGVASARRQTPQQGRHAHVAGVRIPVPGSEYDYDEREAEDMANAMLDEDEIFEQDDGTVGGERDLDDDVPDAAESDQAWEHTDTELEESEMDISILPVPGQGRPSMGQPGRVQPQSVGGPGRSSGPRYSQPGWGFDRSPQVQAQAGHSHRPTPETGHPAPRAAVAGNRHHRPPAPYFHTPAMLDSPMEAETQGTGASDNDDDLDADPFASSGAGPRAIPRPNRHGLSMMASAAEEVSHDRVGRGAATTTANVSGSPSPSRATAARAWLDGAAAAVGGSARRTLFGRAARRGGAGAAGTEGVGADASSGGLFTPPSTSTGTAGPFAGGEWETPGSSAPQEPGQTQAQQRRRSGRFLGSRRRAEP
ncbi:hypothetical protein LTR10_018583 [Elasticomyces elasticus]|uniref:Uncharacterized protein n=1 Tax=Exophiala sideris TaxID=1016849 RepID=A0ABR0JQG4_9EURO|nr:hypothetical protein LTR10_018583 [Elasticomyces elasticus]KAK5038064.1 hypothetical protein LTS07_001532 [Exophiala sideris]KAK5044046.1 hypothetical protein LTR13_000402 [Exophiala sideris]KAK5067546.1 hypothetical protein LTR69_001535 [Exophiala sideris]KAK5184215.1 hypothetical protein LTR44_003721 [Eurotiomycetes sp. CCFEE 6388]